MPIQLSEIDPTLHAALQERLASLFQTPAGLDPMAARVRSAGVRAWKEASRRHSAWFWGSAVSFLTSLVSTIWVAEATKSDAAGLLLLLGMGVAAAFAIGGHHRVKAELGKEARPEVLRAARHLIALSPAEQLYCEAVASLVEAGNILSEETQRETLKQLDSLLASHRKLEESLARYLNQSAGASIDALEQELEELRRQRLRATDPVAQETLDHSVELCTSRLDQARRVAPAREQAEAQQTLIRQTLASVQSSLTRLAATSTSLAPSLEGVQEMRESITSVQRRTQAVEQAVLEVGAIG